MSHGVSMKMEGSDLAMRLGFKENEILRGSIPIASPFIANMERYKTLYVDTDIDQSKVTEEKITFETTLTQSLPVTLTSCGQLIMNYLKQLSNIISWNQQGQFIYKDDVIENSNMVGLL